MSITASNGKLIIAEGNHETKLKDSKMKLNNSEKKPMSLRDACMTTMARSKEMQNTIMWKLTMSEKKLTLTQGVCMIVMLRSRDTRSRTSLILSMYATKSNDTQNSIALLLNT